MEETEKERTDKTPSESDDDKAKTSAPVDNTNKNKSNKTASGRTKANLWLFSTLALGVVVLVLLFSGFRITGSVIGGGNDISSEEAGQVVVDFANSQTGGGVELVGVDEEYGLYMVTVKYEEVDLPLYVTKDGQALVQGVLPLDDVDDSAQDQDQTQTSDSELSAEVQELIDTYSKGSGTPTLVINCKYKRTGSMAVGEARGAYPEGTEKQDLINTFCNITGDSAFCSLKQEVTQSIDAVDNGLETCTGEAGELIRIYSFHSPTCGYCTTQQPILDTLVAEFPGKIELINICNPIHGAGDIDLCKQETEEGKKDWVF